MYNIVGTIHILLIYLWISVHINMENQLKENNTQFQHLHLLVKFNPLSIYSDTCPTHKNKIHAIGTNRI
jgi:hypothetical protein